MTQPSPPAMYFIQKRNRMRRLHQLLLCSILCTLFRSSANSQTQQPEQEPAPAVHTMSSRVTSALGVLSEVRDHVADRGLGFSFTLIDDWSNTLSGGLESPAAFNRVLFDVTTSIQTRKLFGWEGGSAVFRVHQYAGSNGGDFVGDAQGFSNIDAQPGTKLFEAWYEQKFGEHPWRVRGGIVDANTIYATVEHASDFLDSSMGYSPTILHLPTYPDPQPGLNLMFDGERNSLALGAYRTSEDGWMALTQVARRIPLSESLETRIAGGLWHLRERLQPLTGPAEDFTTGLFLVSELAVRIPATTSRKADQTLALFVQYGHSDEDVSDVHTHIGTGLTLQGPWGRTEDAFGMGISAVQFKPTGSAHNYEASFETFYKLQIIRNLRLVADFQYIQQPGGPQNVPDCIVFTPRLVLSF